MADTAFAIPSATASLFLPGTYTISTLPAATNNPRMYAWVTDLFGGPGDYCISDGTYWKPVRPLSAVSLAPATMTLQALRNPPTVAFTGSIGVGVTASVTFSPLLAYPGARFRILSNVSGLGTFNVLGAVNTVGASLITAMSLGKWADHEYINGLGWTQTASGGLL